MKWFGKKKPVKTVQPAKPIELAKSAQPASSIDDATPIRLKDTKAGDVAKPRPSAARNTPPSFPIAATLDWKLIIFPPHSIRAYFEAGAVDAEALERELEAGGIAFSLLQRKTKPSQLVVSGKQPIRTLVMGGVRFYGWEEIIKTSVMV